MRPQSIAMVNVSREPASLGVAPNPFRARLRVLPLIALLLGAWNLPVRGAPVPAPANGSPAPGAAQNGVQAPAPTGLVTIESDQQRADNATGIVTATGNVRIIYPDRRVVATSRQAQYFTREGRIVLTGDVDVVQEGGNLLRAERVVYMVESERVLAQPSGGAQVFSQLRLQTQPAAASSPPPPASPPDSPQPPAPAGSPSVPEGR